VTIGTIWWDFDGTLVSRPSMWAHAGYRVISAHRPELAIDLEQFRYPLSIGFPWHRPNRGHPELATPDQWWSSIYRHYADVFTAMGWPVTDANPILHGIREHILDAQEYAVFEDVVPVLTDLSALGWRHVVVSNHVPELAMLIETLRLSDFFDAVVTSGIVGYEKPHRRMFETAMAHTRGNGPVWMVGDNPVADCEAATAFGVNAVLVRKRSGFHRQADDLWGVAALLRSR
jgi:putative hydrolase of the HAD superfamily